MRLAARAALTLLLAACDNRRDVFLGTVASGSGGALPGGDGLCEQHPVGAPVPRRFIDASAPADAPARFESAMCETSDVVRIRYPSDEAKLPINLAAPVCSWESDAPGTLFRLELQTAKALIWLYTTQTSWSPPADVWSELLRDAPSVLTLRVSVLNPDRADRAWQSRPVRLGLGAALPESPIYYWSTTAHGLMRTDLTGALPQRVAPPGKAEEAAQCVGCHSLSRDGLRVALHADDGHLRVLQTEQLRPVLVGGSGGAEPKPGKMDKTGPGAPGAWSAFSPDGSRLVVASNEALTLTNSDGMPLAPAKATAMLPAKSFAAHPEWTPAGDRIVFTLAEKGGGRAIEKGQIVSISCAADALGAIEILVSAQGDENNFAPSVSPDGRYVAFVNTRGKSYDSTLSQLRLLRLSDNFVFPLTRLNTRVDNQDSSEPWGNTLPTWVSSSDGAELWLTFSSVRPYANLRARDPKLDQLWIAAIDPAAEDPASAALWAPFQRLSHGNHRALWGAPTESVSCGCHELCADNLDNDCDGTTDEPDCTTSCAAEEICNDGIDNDCDCVIDDCPGEDCGDGVDNDDDGAIDQADAACGE